MATFFTNQHDVTTLICDAVDTEQIDIGNEENLDSVMHTLNLQEQGTQTLVTGTSGTDFNISSATGIHTFNLPNASALNRGLVSTGTQTITGAKTFSSGIVSNSLTSEAGTGLTLNSSSNQNITIDAQGTGKVLINTVHPQSLIIGVDPTSISDGVYISSSGDITKPNLVMGVYYVSSEYHPYVASTIPGVGVQNLRCGYGGGSKTIINDISSTDASFTHACEIVGSTNIGGSGSLYFGNSLLCDLNKNITCNNLTATGTVSLPASTIIYGMYGNTISVAVVSTGTPENLSFNTSAEQGITIAGSNNFTIATTGLYEILFNGHVYGTDVNITNLKILITKNGSTVDNKAFRTSSSAIFSGDVSILSILSLVATDVIRIAIITDVNPTTTTFSSATLGDINSRLLIKKLN